jgi:hypothetical protein
MPQRIVKRPMTEKERDYLSRRLKGSPSTAGRWKRGVENAVIMWALTMLVFVFGWKGVAWVARRTVQADIGWRSPGAIWVVIAGVVACAAYSVFSTVRWMKKWRDMRRALRADLESEEIAEEHYEFIGAKRFQEPEHGGLMYFLRTVDNKVFVLFDYESQGLGAEGQDPLASEFRPREKFDLVRAPHSGIVLAQSFSGAPLEIGAPIEFSVGPSKWPEWDCYCDIRWDELENRFGENRRKSG